MHLPPLQLRFLGQYTVSVGERLLPPFPTEKSRSLFAYLALHPAPHARSHLAALFWPDLVEKMARRRLTQELWRIGSELAKVGVADAIQASGASVSLNDRLPIACDVLILQDALAHLRGDDPRTWPTLDDLVDLHQGDLLPGLYDEWVLVDRERLFASYKDGLAHLLAHRKQLGEWAEAGRVADALLAHDPLGEEWVVETLRIAQALNRPEAGLRHYERYAERLRTELESAPDAVLAELAGRLMAQSRRTALSQTVAFTAPAYQPPLIGRDGERALLLRVLEQAQAGHGQIVLLEGAAGVGMSRLLEALAGDAHWRGWLVGRGAAQEIGIDQPYHPLFQALGELLSPLRAQQLRVLLDPIWLAVAARLLPVLADWLPDLPTPLPLDPAPERVRVLESLTRLILALGQLAPTVLVLDDLQWADSASLGLLTYLSRRVAESPLLLLLAYRGEEARTNPAVWVSLAEIDRGSRPQRLQLDGISAQETGELVRNILGMERSASLFEQRIYTQTQGNPFFVLETLRALYQEGNLTPTPQGGWQTPWDKQTVDYREVSIPPEVATMIQRRLTHLLPEEHQALEAAAVLGSTFDLTLLAALLAGDPRQTLAATATLVQRRFLQETPTAYRFEHDQIRQTVYNRLDEARRRGLHRLAAESLARLHPDALPLLAHHFEQAGAMGRAFDYHRRAGDAARATGSYPQARHHYARSVGWLDQVGLPVAARCDLLFTWESVLALLGEREAQAQVLADLAQMKELNQQQQGVLALRQAQFEGASGRLDTAIAAAADCAALAQEMGERLLQSEALSLWGQLLNQTGDLADAEQKLRQAVALAEGAQDARLHAQALIHLADVLPARNAYAEALAAAEVALARYQTLGDVAGEAHANLTLAVIQVERGDVAGGAARYAQALALTEQCGYRYQEARIAANLANALCILGRIGEALALYARGMTIGRQLGDARLEHLIGINYGSTYLSFVGPDDEVIRRVQDALAWSESVGDAIGVGQAWNLLSMAAYYAGDLAQARHALDRSIAAFEGVDYAYIKAQALRAQATLCQAEGNFDEALERIAQALSMSQEIDAIHLVTEMRSIQGEVLLSLGRWDEALAATGEAAAAANPNVFQSYLLHHRHARALYAANHPAEAQAALAQAMDEFTALLDSLSPAQRERSRTAIPAHRQLLADWANTHEPAGPITS